jgi:hypothetical protein
MNPYPARRVRLREARSDGGSRTLSVFTLLLFAVFGNWNGEISIG